MFNRVPSNLLIYKNGVIVALTMRSDLQIIFRLSTYFKACDTYFKEFLFRFPITQTFRAFTAVPLKECHLFLLQEVQEVLMFLIFPGC